MERLRLPISSDLPDSRNTSCPTYYNSSLCNEGGGGGRGRRREGEEEGGGGRGRTKGRREGEKREGEREREKERREDSSHFAMSATSQTFKLVHVIENHLFSLPTFPSLFFMSSLAQ